MTAALYRMRLTRATQDQPWGFRLQGGLQANADLTLLKILPGSAASRCGLRPGDRVVTLAGKPAKMLTHEQAQLLVINAGDELEIVIQRAEKTTEVTKAHVTDDGEQYVNDRNEANQILNAVDQINGKQVNHPIYTQPYKEITYLEPPAYVSINSKDSGTDESCHQSSTQTSEYTSSRKEGETDSASIPSAADCDLISSLPANDLSILKTEAPNCNSELCSDDVKLCGSELMMSSPLDISLLQLNNDNCIISCQPKVENDNSKSKQQQLQHHQQQHHQQQQQQHQQQHQHQQQERSNSFERNVPLTIPSPDNQAAVDCNVSMETMLRHAANENKDVNVANISLSGSTCSVHCDNGESCCCYHNIASTSLANEGMLPQTKQATVVEKLQDEEQEEDDDAYCSASTILSSLDQNASFSSDEPKSTPSSSDSGKEANLDEFFADSSLYHETSSPLPLVERLRYFSHPHCHNVLQRKCFSLDDLSAATSAETSVFRFSSARKIKVGTAAVVNSSPKPEETVPKHNATLASNLQDKLSDRHITSDNCQHTSPINDRLDITLVEEVKEESETKVSLKEDNPAQALQVAQNLYPWRRSKTQQQILSEEKSTNDTANPPDSDCNNSNNSGSSLCNPTVLLNQEPKLNQQQTISTGPRIAYTPPVHPWRLQSSIAVPRKDAPCETPQLNTTTILDQSLIKNQSKMSTDSFAAVHQQSALLKSSISISSNASDTQSTIRSNVLLINNSPAASNDIAHQCFTQNRSATNQQPNFQKIDANYGLANYQQQQQYSNIHQQQSEEINLTNSSNITAQSITMPAVKQMVADLSRRLERIATQHPRIVHVNDENFMVASQPLKGKIQQRTNILLPSNLSDSAYNASSHPSLYGYQGYPLSLQHNLDPVTVTSSAKPGDRADISPEFEQTSHRNILLGSPEQGLLMSRGTVNSPLISRRKTDALSPQPRRVHFADPPESSVIEIESTASGRRKHLKSPQHSSLRVTSPPPIAETSPTSLLEEKLNQIQRENELFAKALSVSRPPGNLRPNPIAKAATDRITLSSLPQPAQRLTAATLASRRRNSQPVMMMSQSPVVLNARPSSGKYNPTYLSSRDNNSFTSSQPLPNVTSSAASKQMFFDYSGQSFQTGKSNVGATGNAFVSGGSNVQISSPTSESNFSVLLGTDSNPERIRYGLSTRGTSEPFNISCGFSRQGPGTKNPIPIIRMESLPIGEENNSRIYSMDSGGKTFHYVTPPMPHPITGNVLSPPRHSPSPLPVILEAPKYHPISSPPPYPGKNGNTSLPSAQDYQHPTSLQPHIVQNLSVGSSFAQRPLSPRLSPLAVRREALSARPPDINPNYPIGQDMLASASTQRQDGGLNRAGMKTFVLPSSSGMDTGKNSALAAATAGESVALVLSSNPVDQLSLPDALAQLSRIPGLFAFFDKTLAEKFLKWQREGEMQLEQSETYKLVRELDEATKQQRQHQHQQYFQPQFQQYPPSQHQQYPPSQN